MQVITLNAADVIQTVSKLWWPVLRISGFVATAPLISGSMVPPRVKILITLALLVLIAPLAPMPASLSFFSAAGLLAALEELLIGVAIGMVVQLTFEALTLAGQTVSMTMGLGFATLIDPQHDGRRAVVLHFRHAGLPCGQRPSRVDRSARRQLSKSADRRRAHRS
jgi:flagellar biosynthetic protein FliR